MQYITKQRVIVRTNPSEESRKRTELAAGVSVNVTNSKTNQERLVGYSYIDYPAVGWVISAYLRLPTDKIDPIVIDPPEGVIWWTGRNKPPGHKPDKNNDGSFAIAWLLNKKPQGYINKPPGFKLDRHHIEYLYHCNPQNAGAVKWLIDDGGTRKILQLDGDQYKCPVPCASEANQIKILEWSPLAIRVETVSIYEKLPDVLPPHLLHKWYGYTKGGIFFEVQAALGGINYPLFTETDSVSSWMLRTAVQEFCPPLK